MPKRRAAWESVIRISFKPVEMIARAYSGDVLKIPKVSNDELKDAAQWAVIDAQDDFCPDYVRYSDYEQLDAQSAGRFRTPCLNEAFHTVERLSVPKGEGILSRDTPRLPFPLRITYMLLLRRLLPVLRDQLSPSCYSSRLDQWDGLSYPWLRGHGVAAWARFINAYRGALIDNRGGGFAVVTDLTAFYEHLEVEPFVDELRGLAGSAADGVSDEFEALSKVLKAASAQGRGLPQNTDASAFLASVYLKLVDDRARGVSGLQYFRYVDDIRLVAPRRGLVIRSIQHVEFSLRNLGLFANSKKTELVDSTGETWRRQQQADHDAVLAKCDEALNDASAEALVAAVESATDGFRSVVDHDDGGRLLRAYGNRLSRFAQFPDLSEPIFLLFEELALPRFRSHPSGADHWARYISAFMSDACQEELNALLSDEDHNTHAWTNMWLRRAGVVAAQELPVVTRAGVFERSVKQDLELSLLWSYLEQHPKYDWFVRSEREYRKPSEPISPMESYEAVGTVGGELRRFRAYSQFENYDD